MLLQPADGDHLVRVMTWNIHGGVGPDRRFDLRRIVALVRRHEPDIVALQEVDARRKDAAFDSSFAFLSEALGPHTAEARLIAAPDGDYGHVVVSRWPLEQTTLHDVSVERREPRAAIEATVATPHGPLRVIAAHLGLSLRERRRQVEALCRLGGSGALPTVMLGDFNDWVVFGAVQRALAACMPGRTRHRTFPAAMPALGLDRIYCRPAELLVRSWTDHAARQASDHLPVIAELRLSPS